MAIVHVTEATVGAPNSGRISGTNGDLYAMLKYALPLNGWAVEYDNPVNFTAVFRPGTGNRFRLYVNDRSAVSGAATLAVVRGCENASSPTTLIDPFPKVANIPNSNCNWVKSDSANTTARSFDIYVGTTWVWYAVNYTGFTNDWETHFFGDVSPSLPGDSYNTIITTRNTTYASGTYGYSISASSPSGLPTVHWCRSYDGTVKDSYGYAWVGSPMPTLGAIYGLPVMQAGPSGGIDRGRIILGDGGMSSTGTSATKGLPVRGYLPNLWMPYHADSRGIVNTRDTFTDSAYNASATFKVFQGTGAIIVEETDTWNPPSG